MRTLQRRLRGISGIALTWGVGWSVIGAALWTVVRFVVPEDIGSGEGILRASAIFGMTGALAGAAFAGLLSLVERRRTLQQLTWTRALVLGAAGTAALTLLTPIPNAMLVILAPLGGLFAAGSIALARRAELRAPARVEHLSSG